jgi:hypothetical protein
MNVSKMADPTLDGAVVHHARTRCGIMILPLRTGERTVSTTCAEPPGRDPTA